jgi:PAS domain S-box-containing protein
MIFLFRPYSILFAVGSLILLVLAIITWKRRPAPGATAFSLFSFAIFIWSFFWLLEVGTTNISDKIIWAKMEYLGIATSMPLWLIFTFSYTGQSWRKPLYLLLLCLIPALTLAVIETNELHHWFWSNIYEVNKNVGRVTIWEHGFWFWVFAAYQYLLIVFGLFRLWRHKKRDRRIYVRQNLALTFGALAPVLVNLIYLLRIPAFEGLDFTPLSIALSGCIYVLAIFRYHLLDISAVARNTLVEKVPDGILVVNMDGQIVDFNPAAEQIRGLTRSQMHGHYLCQIWPALDKIRVEARGDTLRYIASHDSGTPFDLELSLTDIIDKKNKSGGYLFMLRDITERHRMEQAILESEKRYSTLVEQSHNGVVLIQNGRYLFVNQAICQMTGYSTDDFIDHSLPFPFTDEFANLIMERYEQRSAGRVVPKDYDIRIKRKDGNLVDLELSVATITYRGTPTHMVTVRDVTERRRMELMIVESEKRYSTLVEQSYDGIAITKKGIVQFANSAFAGITGYSKQELINHPIRLFLDENNALNLRNIAQTIREGAQAARSLEVTLQRKDGQVRDIDITMGPITYEGAPTTILTIRDITERKATQRKLEELFNKEKQLTADLQAEIDNRSKYTRALIHELKTPLTAILSSSELLEISVTDKFLTSVTKNIRQASLNLEYRTNELIDLARGEIGMLTIESEPLNIVSLIDKVTRSKQSDAQKKGLKLIHEIGRLPLVKGDFKRLESVFNNLIHNAISYSERGNILVKAVDYDSDNLLIQIQDWGKGIKPEFMKNLFDPFRRKSTEGQKYGGLGVGLALCRTYIELHQGKIWVDSTPGVGTTFSFTLPIHQDNHLVREITPLLNNNQHSP